MGTGNVKALDYPEEDSPASSGARVRRRGLSAAMLGANSSQPGLTSLLVMLLLGGGGGTAIGAGFFGDDKAGIEALQQAKDNAREQERLAGELAAIREAQGATDRRMSRWQVSTLRWISDAQQKQLEAIGAIAEKVGVKVDVRPPPMPLDVLQPADQ